MNFEHVKKLVVCNRYGEVIHLIRNNIHLWSSDDYCTLFILCCGLKSQKSPIHGIYSDIFSEECILYMMDNMDCSNIINVINNIWFGNSHRVKNVIAYEHDSVRLFKRELFYGARYGKCKQNGDISKYCIQKRKPILGCISPVYLDLVHKIGIYKCFGQYHYGLLYWYSKGEYTKGDELCDMILLLYKNYYYYSMDMNTTIKYKTIFKHFYNNDIEEICKCLIDNKITVTELKRIRSCYEGYSRKIVITIDKIINIYNNIIPISSDILKVL